MHFVSDRDGSLHEATQVKGNLLTQTRSEQIALSIVTINKNYNTKRLIGGEEGKL